MPGAVTLGTSLSSSGWFEVTGGFGFNDMLRPFAVEMSATAEEAQSAE